LNVSARQGWMCCILGIMRFGEKKNSHKKAQKSQKEENHYQVSIFVTLCLFVAN
jgi:hypothetical protein